MTNIHTPGPWIAKKTCQSGKVQILGISEGYTYTIMTISPSINKSAKGDEMQANARLITAAPELLEALEGLQAWMDDKFKEHISEYGDLDLFKDARAAIAKARGE